MSLPAAHARRVGRSSRTPLGLAVALAVALLGACRKPPPAETTPGAEPRASTVTEAPEAGAAGDAQETRGIDYWREQVRKVAAQSAVAKVDAGAPAEPRAVANLPLPAGAGRAELRLGGRAACEGRVATAWKQVNEGAVASAEAELRAVLRQEPDCGVGHMLLGQIAYQRGDFTQALAEWEEARRLSPDIPGLDALIAKAKKEMRLDLGQEDSSHFLVSFDGRADKEAGKKAVEWLEEARRVVGKAFDYFPADAVPVILYPGETFREASGRPAWAEGLYDGKIRLASSGAERRPDEFRATLFHEYTHALVHRMASGQRVPAWLNEGLAEYAESLAPGARGRVRSARAAAWIPLSELHDSFSRLDERSARVAYAEAQLAVADLVQRYRTYRVRELLERLGRGRSFESAFEDTYLVSYETFAKQAPRR